MAQEDPSTTESIPQSDAEWKEVLTEQEYRILRERGTEPKFSGEYIDVDEDGVYRCAGCGTELFDSDTKFDSGSGWPSFYDAKDGAVEFHEDTRHGMTRTEVVCSTCGGHLGHVFDDGPDPTGKRFCINSAALDFEEDDE
ncbi:MAG: peptide-methionine (R)-S-oxide reductase MsrB [Halobacteriales archaeon]